MDRYLKPKQKHTTLIVISIIIVLILAGAFAYAYSSLKHTSSTPKNDVKATTSTTQTKANTSHQSTDGASDASGSKTSSSGYSATSGQSSTTVGVAIVAAAQQGNAVVASAYANALADGTCTYTFSHGSTVITKQTPAQTGPSTTSCETLNTPSSQFSSGTWSLKVSYASTSGNDSGVSSAKAITIQ